MPRSPGPRTLSETARRTLVPWAVACAQRSLPLFEAAAPEDARPRAALDGALAFARGELAIGPVRALAAQAHAAARAVDDPAAEAAARACGHAAAVAHMAAHALGAPAYAALALERRHGPEAREALLAWALAAAGPEVKAVLATLPARPPGRQGLARLVGRLDQALADRAPAADPERP